MVTRIITNREGKKYTEDPKFLLEDIKKHHCRSLSLKHYALVFKEADPQRFDKLLRERGGMSKRSLLFEELNINEEDDLPEEYAFVNPTTLGLRKSLKAFLGKKSLRKKGIEPLVLYEINEEKGTIKQKRSY